MTRLQSLVLSGALLGALAGTAVAAPAPGKKALVCHGTASVTNPFVLIDVSVNSNPAAFDDTDGQSRNLDFPYDPTFPDCLTQFLAGQYL
ncbi:MAG TPA: hypothetical protein VGC78_07330 [Gaiellaceae bacterium]